MKVRDFVMGVIGLGALSSLVDNISEHRWIEFTPERWPNTLAAVVLTVVVLGFVARWHAIGLKEAVGAMAQVSLLAVVLGMFDGAILDNMVLAYVVIYFVSKRPPKLRKRKEVKNPAVERIWG